MARIKLVYLGGGSTRAAGTMASLIENGADFTGSEVVLVDLDPERLEVVGRWPSGWRREGLDLTVRATTDRRAALEDCDAVLSSFRPGGFAARVHDERIPLSHGVIGQETQGPGGFFMALRAIAVLQQVCAEMEEACPDRADLQLHQPRQHRRPGRRRAFADRGGVAVRGADLFRGRHRRDWPSSIREKLEATMVGLNHGCWSVEHTLRRRRPDRADPAGLGAAAGRPHPDRRAAPHPAAGGDHGGDSGRLLWLLLLPRRDPGRARRPSRPLAPRTSSRGSPTTGSHYREAGAERQPARSTPAAPAAGSTSSSSRST